MIPLSLDEIAAATGGEVHGGAGIVVTADACMDSRAVAHGGLFVAVAGERVDGHEYAGAAHAAGAAAILATRPTSAPTVVVADAVTALGRLARHVLDQLPDVQVLAVTGSQGKTGTKDYLAAVLAGAGPTVATAGNFNNEIGLPLTVLRADAETAYLVVEMGARRIGDLAHLCAIAPPDVAAVVNVGTAHIGEFGSREAIAQAKGEIVEALTPEGTAVLGADDPVVLAMAARTRGRVLTFGRDGDVSWRGTSADDLGRPTFELGHAGQWHPVSLAQLGAHQLVNAAAAATMALAVGVPLAGVAVSLSAARPGSRWRMEVHERVDGVLVINDAYNANPASMEAAINTLGAIGRRGRRTVAVLGEMRELGGEAERAHVLVGMAAAMAGIDVIVAVGPMANAFAQGATRHFGWTGQVVATAGRDEALDWVRNNVLVGDVVLVKASRGVALEHVADGLLDAGPGRGEEGD